MAYSKIVIRRWLFPLLIATSVSLPIIAHRVIIGGGHIGIVDALTAYDHDPREEITLYTKNESVKESTAANIWNSHTHNEIMSVIPPSNILAGLLKKPFDQEGLFVPDVPGAQKSASAQRFFSAVEKFGSDTQTQGKNDKALRNMGYKGMSRWKEYNDKAEGAKKTMLTQSNFNPCANTEGAKLRKPYQGYRIDLMYGYANAAERGRALVEEMKTDGYIYSAILEPAEVLNIDPFLKGFVDGNSTGVGPNRKWKNDAVAVWRGGGSLDTETFLPKGPEYLKQAMGNQFEITYNREVVGVDFGPDGSGNLLVTGLKFRKGFPISIPDPLKTRFDFIPGESVGTLEKLGFFESPYAGFAGCSLKLEVDIAQRPDLLEKYGKFKHHMEVHRPGIILAWQARLRDKKLFVGGAGTKAFYGDVEPKLQEKFATTNNLKQLQMFRDVLPDIVALALGVQPKDLPKQMTSAHMKTLEDKKIATRWVGRRSVRFNGMPSVGFLYREEEGVLKKVRNATTITHAGSGGGSFSMILALLNNYAYSPENYKKHVLAAGITEEEAKEWLALTDSRLQPTNGSIAAK